MSRADELIRNLISSPDQPDHETLANELLWEYGNGHPLETLRPLLNSPHTEVVGVAMFIVSELGNSGASLLNDVARILHHSDIGIRFDVIDSLLTCATASDGDKIAPVVLLLSDPDKRIRWKAMEFLSLASGEQIRAAVTHFQEHQPNSPHIVNLNWVNSDSACNVDDVERMIRSPDCLSRKYGIIAATRIARQTQEPLRHGLSSEDTEIVKFAKSMLKLIEASE